MVRFVNDQTGVNALTRMRMLTRKGRLEFDYTGPPDDAPAILLRRDRLDLLDGGGLDEKPRPSHAA